MPVARRARRFRAILTDSQSVVRVAPARPNRRAGLGRPRPHPLPARLRPHVRAAAAAPATAARRLPRELALLLTLAAVQFTHIVDFMIMMPLGPQFMRLFGDRSAAVRLAGVGVHVRRGGERLRRRVLDRPLRPQARVARALRRVHRRDGAVRDRAELSRCCWRRAMVAGAFGGVIGGLAFAIVADAVPYARRARATAIVAAAFSLAAVAGVPLGALARRALLVADAVPGAGRDSASASALAAMRLLPPLRAHLAHGAAPAPAGAAAADLRRAQPPARVRLHDRADVRRLHGDPVHRAVQRRQRRRRRGRSRRRLLRRRRRHARSPRR